MAKTKFDFNNRSYDDIDKGMQDAIEATYIEAAYNKIGESLKSELINSGGKIFYRDNSLIIDCESKDLIERINFSLNQ